MPSKLPILSKITAPSKTIQHHNSKSIFQQFIQETPWHSLHESVHFNPCFRHEQEFVLHPVLHEHDRNDLQEVGVISLSRYFFKPTPRTETLSFVVLYVDVVCTIQEKNIWLASLDIIKSHDDEQRTTSEERKYKLAPSTKAPNENTSAKVSLFVCFVLCAFVSVSVCVLLQVKCEPQLTCENDVEFTFESTIPSFLKAYPALSNTNCTCTK